MQISNSSYNAILNSGLSYNLKYEKEFAKFESQNSNWWQISKENSASNTAYSIKIPRTQMSFREGVIWEFAYPQNASTPFSNAVSENQPAVSESEYNQAMNRIKDLMDEITTFAISEQGADSELGFMLEQMDKSFTLEMISQSIKLDIFKNQLKSYEGDEEALVDAMMGYVSSGSAMATHYIAKFFDYASDKIAGLPVAQIVRDLSMVKGYWDNNTEQNFIFDDGTRLSLYQVFDEKNQIYKTKINIDNIKSSDTKFDENTFENQNFKVLLAIFKQRENLNGVNSSENSALNKNSNENSKNSVNLDKNSNSNLQSNKINSNDSLLKVLLNSV